MRANQVRPSELIYVERNASVQEAARLMKKYGVGAVVVLGNDGSYQPLGILTDRDIAIKVVAEGKNANISVKEVMSVNLVVASIEDDLPKIVERMDERGTRRVILTDVDGNACGLVSMDEILQEIFREATCLSRVLDRQTRYTQIRMDSDRQELI